jgi:hypothetical protein
MTATPDDGKQAARVLLEPTVGPAETTVPATNLYHRRTPLSDDQGVAVHSREDPPIQWAITPGDGQFLALQAGQPIAARPRFVSAMELARAFDRIVSADGDLVRIDSTGERCCSYDSKADVRAELQPVSEPALPGTLADALESVTVFAQRGSRFAEIRLTAPWDQQLITIRERDAGRTFLKRFTIPDTDSELPLSEVLPQFVSWIRHQTSEPLSTSLDHALRSAYADQIGFDGCPPPRADTLPNRSWIYRPFTDR